MGDCLIHLVGWRSRENYRLCFQIWTNFQTWASSVGVLAQSLMTLFVFLVPAVNIVPAVNLVPAVNRLKKVNIG